MFLFISLFIFFEEEIRKEKLQKKISVSREYFFSPRKKEKEREKKEERALELLERSILKLKQNSNSSDSIFHIFIADRSLFPLRIGNSNFSSSKMSNAENYICSFISIRFIIIS